MGGRLGGCRTEASLVVLMPVPLQIGIIDEIVGPDNFPRGAVELTVPDVGATAKLIREDLQERIRHAGCSGFVSRNISMNWSSERAIGELDRWSDIGARIPMPDFTTPARKLGRHGGPRGIVDRTPITSGGSEEVVG
jgi:hypothetical protein